MASAVNKVARGVVNISKIVRDRIPMTLAKIVARTLLTVPRTNGRLDVRAINLSVSASMTMLKALEAPAARVPPMRVAATKPKDGSPFSAKTMAGSVVMIRSSTTRSFMRST